MSNPNLIRKLRPLYCPEKGFALYEQVESSTGGPRQGTRRADGVIASIWPSRGLFYELLEEKHTLSDLGRDLRVPSKAETIGRFCKRRWLVIPPTLKLKTQPDGWGVYIVGTGKPYVPFDWEAPERESVEPPSDGFLQSLLASGCTAAEEAAISEAPMVQITRPNLSRTHAGLGCGHVTPITWKVGKPPGKVPCLSCLADDPKDVDLIEAAIEDADEATLRRLQDKIAGRLG